MDPSSQISIVVLGRRVLIMVENHGSPGPQYQRMQGWLQGLARSCPSSLSGQKKELRPENDVLVFWFL